MKELKESQCEAGGQRDWLGAGQMPAWDRSHPQGEPDHAGAPSFRSVMRGWLYLAHRIRRSCTPSDDHVLNGPMYYSLMSDWLVGLTINAGPEDETHALLAHPEPVLAHAGEGAMS